MHHTVATHTHRHHDSAQHNITWNLQLPLSALSLLGLSAVVFGVFGWTSAVLFVHEACVSARNMHCTPCPCLFVRRLSLFSAAFLPALSSCLSVSVRLCLVTLELYHNRTESAWPQGSPERRNRLINTSFARQKTKLLGF